MLINRMFLFHNFL